MGLAHGQIQESNARTRLRLYERVANHVGWNPMQTSNAGTRLPSMLHNRVPALDACIGFHGCAIAFLHWIPALDSMPRGWLPSHGAFGQENLNDGLHAVLLGSHMVGYHLMQPLDKKCE